MNPQAQAQRSPLLSSLGTYDTMHRSKSEDAFSKSSVGDDSFTITSSRTIPSDQKLTIDQMVASALKQAHELRDTYDRLQSLPESSDDTQETKGSDFNSSPIKSGSSPSSDEPTTLDITVNPTSSSENKSSPSSGSGEPRTINKSSPSSGSCEPSSGSAEGGQTASLSSGDAIVDEMVMEASKYVQDAKENSGTRTGQSEGVVSVHSHYSRTNDPESNEDMTPWYACLKLHLTMCHRG